MRPMTRSSSFVRPSIDRVCKTTHKYFFHGVSDFKKRAQSSMTPSHQQTTGIHSLLGGGGLLMRLSITAAACLVAVSIAIADNAHAAIRKPTHIAADGLGSALQALAKERG